jgi:metal-responsive CopG/Arc/MetJ family transcriptional regulator
MKTAVSLPDKLFERADRAARSMGKSRSELYRVAVEEYLDRHDAQAVTRRIDEVCDPQPDSAWLESQLELLRRNEW